MWDFGNKTYIFLGNGRVGKKIIQSGQQVNKEWIYSGSGREQDITLQERNTKKQSRADL